MLGGVAEDRDPHPGIPASRSPSTVVPPDCAVASISSPHDIFLRFDRDKEEIFSSGEPVGEISAACVSARSSSSPQPVDEEGSLSARSAQTSSGSQPVSKEGSDSALGSHTPHKRPCNTGVENASPAPSASSAHVRGHGSLSDDMAFWDDLFKIAPEIICPIVSSDLPSSSLPSSPVGEATGWSLSSCPGGPVGESPESHPDDEGAEVSAPVEECQSNGRGILYAASPRTSPPRSAANPGALSHRSPTPVGSPPLSPATQSLRSGPSRKEMEHDLDGYKCTLGFISDELRVIRNAARLLAQTPEARISSRDEYWSRHNGLVGAHGRSFSSIWYSVTESTR